MAGITGNQIGIGHRIMGHVGDDAHAQSQANIGLDHVRIRCSEYQPWRQGLGLKGLIQPGAPGETEGVGHQGEAGQIGQAD